jgi:hypothetical protein
MPIAAISLDSAMSDAQSVESSGLAAAPARAADAVAAGAEVKSLAALVQDPAAGTQFSGDLTLVHDFDPERMARLLKLLE